MRVRGKLRDLLLDPRRSIRAEGASSSSSGNVKARSRAAPPSTTAARHERARNRGRDSHRRARRARVAWPCAPRDRGRVAHRRRRHPAGARRRPRSSVPRDSTSSGSPLVSRSSRAAARTLRARFPVHTKTMRTGRCSSLAGLVMGADHTRASEGRPVASSANDVRRPRGPPHVEPDDVERALVARFAPPQDDPEKEERRAERNGHPQPEAGERQGVLRCLGGQPTRRPPRRQGAVPPRPPPAASEHVSSPYCAVAEVFFCSAFAGATTCWTADAVFFAPVAA